PRNSRWSATSGGGRVDASRLSRLASPCAALLRRASAQRPELLRRWRRCTVTIEKPAPIIRMPTATIQRRSRPVNGSDFAASVLVVEVVVVFSGVVAAFDGLTSLAGEVPLFGVVVVGVVVVVVVVFGSAGFWA